MNEEKFAKIAHAVVFGNTRIVGDLVHSVLKNGAAPQEVLEKGLMAGISVVSDKYKTQEIFIPDVLLASRAMHAGLHILKPLLPQDAGIIGARALIGTVQGDLHDIGKSLVSIMWRGAGLEVIDLGIDLSPQDFVQAVKKYEPDVIGLSALLTTTLPMMPATLEALTKAGLRNKVKVIVGGGPVTKEYAKLIGADGYGGDAYVAAQKAISLVKAKY